MRTGPRFTVSITGDFDLALDQIWPDGDEPANPTAQDVADVMRKCGGRFSVLNEWCLEPTVLVYGPDPSSMRAEVWSA